MYTNKLKAVGEMFRLPGTLYSYTSIANGNINKTFKVDYMQADGILINIVVFKRDEGAYHTYAEDE